VLPTAEDLQQFLRAEFPESMVIVERVSEQRVWLRHGIDFQHLRPGGTVSGPTMMALADCAAYTAVLAAIGIVPLAVTTNLNINFLRRPAAERAVLAEAGLLKLGKRLAVVEVRLCSEGEAAPVAHATVTYAIPPNR
jgi:uncharacterized protein (TIGR00369 family)